MAEPQGGGSDAEAQLSTELCQTQCEAFTRRCKTTGQPNVSSRDPREQSRAAGLLGHRPQVTDRRQAEKWSRHRGTWGDENEVSPRRRDSERDIPVPARAGVAHANHRGV